MNTKQRLIAKDKELQNEIHNLQDKMENLCDNSLMSDEALRQLSNTNAELYRKITDMMYEINQIKTDFNDRIVRSRFIQAMDTNYHSRQLKKREEKLNSDHWILCCCGEPIVDSNSDKNLNAHKKTEKHIQSMLRINVDKHSVFDANNFQKYMVLNSLISNMVNGGSGNRYYPTKYKIGDYGAKLPSSMNQDVNPFIEYKRKVYIKGAKQFPKLYILEMLIKRYKIRKLGH